MRFLDRGYRNFLLGLVVPTNNSSHAKEDVEDSPFRSFPHCSQRAFDFRWSYW